MTPSQDTLGGAQVCKAPPGFSGTLRNRNQCPVVGNTLSQLGTGTVDDQNSPKDPQNTKKPPIPPQRLRSGLPSWTCTKVLQSSEFSQPASHLEAEHSWKYTVFVWPTTSQKNQTNGKVFIVCQNLENLISQTVHLNF